jgi:hypothetical protein
MSKANWTIKDYIEELICICEVIEIPGFKAKRDELLAEMQARFTADELEDAGICLPA